MGAAPLHKDDVVPDAVQLAVTLAVTHLAKSASQMERRTRSIRSHHLRLQCPVAFAFGLGDQAFEQRAAQSVPSCARGNVDADLSDAGCASRIRNRRERRPSGDLPFGVARDETAGLQVAAIPAFPLRSAGGECGETRAQPLGVDPPHVGPVVLLHRCDGVSQARCPLRLMRDLEIRSYDVSWERQDDDHSESFVGRYGSQPRIAGRRRVGRTVRPPRGLVSTGRVHERRPATTGRASERQRPSSSGVHAPHSVSSVAASRISVRQPRFDAVWACRPALPGSPA